MALTKRVLQAACDPEPVRPWEAEARPDARRPRFVVAASEADAAVLFEEGSEAELIVRIVLQALRTRRRPA